MAKIYLFPGKILPVLVIPISRNKTSMMLNDKPFVIDREKLHVLYGSTKVILDRTPGESKGK